MSIKSVVLHKKAREAIKGFPKEVKKDIGKFILDLQYGEALVFPISRPMQSVGKGVSEIRLRNIDGTFRVFYYTKVKELILVFHAFQKKDQKTPKKEIALGKARLKEMLEKYNEKE